MSTPQLKVKRRVVALLEDGSVSKTIIGKGMEPGVLYQDEMTYKVDYKNLSESDKAMLSVDLIRENDDLLNRLFKVEMEVVEE